MASRAKYHNFCPDVTGKPSSVMPKAEGDIIFQGILVILILSPEKTSNMCYVAFKKSKSV